MNPSKPFWDALGIAIVLLTCALIIGMSRGCPSGWDYALHTWFDKPIQVCEE